MTTKPKESIALRVEAGLPLTADGLLAVTCTEPAPRTGTLSQPDKRVFGKRAEPEDVWGVCSGGLERNRWKTKAVCEVTEVSVSSGGKDVETKDSRWMVQRFRSQP